MVTQRLRISKLLCLFLSLISGACWLFPISAAHAAYVKRYTTISNGGMTYTGNTLGLSKRSSYNEPGTSGAIGTFITTNTTSRDGTSWPLGTTANWTLNRSSAPLRMPAGSNIIYAELIWGGSYNYGGQNVSSFLNNAVLFSGPFGNTSVTPSPATAAVTGSGEYYYVRSADVTSYVRIGGGGTYTVAGVPGTEGTSENNANAAGWTLAVIYGNPSLPARNMTIFVGAELTSSSVSTTSSVSGFCTPSSGPINARMMVSAIEGDSNLTGDQMQFGPTVGTLSAVSGPNNPLNNFFCSQINKDDGTLDTAGTFGSANHTPGSNSSGRRQGWDITNVDVSSRMQNGQNTAYARGTTSSDRYTVTSIGLQIDVGAPIFPEIVLTVDKVQTYVGDILTYTALLDNSAGSADAINTVYSDSLPQGTAFVPNTFYVDGVLLPGADPTTGVNLGTIAAGTGKTASYQVQVTAIPLPPAPAVYQGVASWTYEYESCPSFPINSNAVTTNITTTGIIRLQPTKSADPSGAVLPGGRVTYTVTVPNTGTQNSSGTTLTDTIPVGTTYIPGTTRLNGIPVTDGPGGIMPYENTALINSPGEPAGQVNIGESAIIAFDVEIIPDPPLIITNTAYIDPDGPGPAPAVTAIVTNPPVRSDLSVSITDGLTTVTAGMPVIYSVAVTNNGPDTVIGNILSVQLPTAITNSLYTPSTGTYNQSTGEWTGFTLASGQTIILQVQGMIAPGAVGPLTATATVAPSPGVEDPNMNNNTASDTDTVNYIADLAITKDDGQAAVRPNMALTYTIAVTNNGPSRVSEATVTDILPTTLQNPVFTPSRGTYNETTGLWTGLNLLPGQTANLILTATTDPAISGDLINTVTVAPPADVTDPNLENNTATDTNVTTALISLTKSVSDTTAVPGTVLTYSVAYKNTGGDIATSLFIVDAIPAYTDYEPNSLRMCQGTCTYSAGSTPLTDIPGDLDGGQCDGTTVVFTIPTVAADDGISESGADEGVAFFRVKVK